MNRKLTFGDLEIGERFIDFPSEGDDDGHGGYMNTYNVFIKISECREETFEMNAVNPSTGYLSHFNNEMNVIKISK